MSQSTPFGTPLDPEMPPIDAPPIEPEAPRGRGRTIAIAGGATAALVVAGVAAWVLIGDGGGEDAPVMGLPTRPSATASMTPSTSSPEVSVLPTNVVVNARNPFLRAPSDAASGDATGGAGSGGAVSVRTVTRVRVVTEAGPTATIRRTATIRSTATATATPVYLTLVSLDSAPGNEAAFSVIEKGVNTLYTPIVGGRFGQRNEFTYNSTTDVSGTTCAKVTYVDHVFNACPGSIVQAH